MKVSILGILALTLSMNVYADVEKREYKKLNSIEALVTITTEETDGTQAAVYVDAKENDQFVADLLKDSSSKLAQLVKKIELEVCGETSTPEKKWIDGCGEVTLTESVRTSFGRGGWAEANASYTFFVGFSHDGTGRFFNASHMVTISESAVAQTKPDDYEYNGVILKYLSLDTVTNIENSAE